MVFGHTRVYLSHTQILARYELTCKYHNALKLPTSVTCCQESCTKSASPSIMRVGARALWAHQVYRRFREVALKSSQAWGLCCSHV